MESSSGHYLRAHGADWFEVACVESTATGVRAYSPLRLWTAAARKTAGQDGRNEGTRITKASKAYIYIHLVLARPPAEIDLGFEALREASSNVEKMPEKPPEHKTFWDWAAALATQRCSSL
jgi:hypothetical protein